ncbi:ABC-type Fe3+ transport system, permease component [Oleiphilus messinensis]|uniref:ABC-type Fe3+ transport system, permease component n=1 Tax=Oleiphilus messinensis TaxID=141451 RepID=A0A1Y0I9D0_9GAMM|nr:iron ABC transporter permease [Oleiphilus messinensis]ARU57118.1 ABC-type Fe3+ transport system, permease component [Oleiphilus messinensis]
MQAQLSVSSLLFLRSKLSAWTAITFVISIIVILPIAAVFYLAMFPEDNIWPHLMNTVLPDYLLNTLLLMLGVGICSLLLGIGSAWLVSSCDFPGRKVMNWALLLPFAVPAYVIAYVYTDILEYAGPIQGFLRDVFGWKSASDYWFPEIRSMGGAIVMMSLVLYPYIYMMAKTSFKDQPPTLFITSRSLGRTAWSSFFTVALPIARPAIIVGLSLVLMETLNDFGTVDYFAVRTLTAGLYDTWLNLANVGGAAQIAVVMLLFMVSLILSERHSRRKLKLYQNKLSPYGKDRIPLPGIYGITACIACLLPILLGFIIPFSILAYYAFVYFEKSWTPEFVEYALNSFTLAVVAALFTLTLGIILSYTNRLIKSGPIKILVRLAHLGYAVPGAVLAVGVIVPLAAFDNIIDGFFRTHFDQSTGLIFSGTVFALVFAYSVRFLAVAAGSVESSLEKVTPNMDMASRSLGLNSLQVLLKVHLPIIKGGLLTAILVVFVDCMKELPATLILRPFNFETLATFVYQFASDELLEESALAALIIVAVGIIPVILLSHSMDTLHKRSKKSLDG